MSPTYKLLITTSGTGSRLGELTRHKNKALIEVGEETALVRILDLYDPSVPIVITLGYLGDQIKEYMASSYPDRKVEFVVVDRYEGPGTSCGYSILAARDKLQCPFIFHACDTIVFEQIPTPSKNWTAGYMNSHIAKDVIEKNFATQLTDGTKLIKVNPLGAVNYNYIHMGITAIADYKTFWSVLESEYIRDPNNSKLTDINVINRMLSDGFDFEVTPFNIWLDVGNPNTLKHAQEYFYNKNE